MINPFLTGLTILCWFLSFTYSYEVLVFAIGLSIYLVILTLFVAPTIPRGQLPQLDDLYIRAIFDCLKSRKLKDPQNDAIPQISSAASHLLFSLDTVWQLDSSIGGLLDKSESDPQIVEYCTQTPIERSQRVYANDSDNSESTKNVTTEAKEFITSHIQRIRTIPLSIMPSNYFVPLFSLEASIQTFLHFPLPVWQAEMKMSDLTIYFPAPRGAQFFYESNIVGCRDIDGNGKADLAVDIQTTISIDRNRLEKLYSEEEEFDSEEREYIAKLQQQDIETQTREMEKMGNDQQKKAQERRKKVLRQPEQLVLVARVVTTYVYPNVITPAWKSTTQKQFPHTATSFEDLLGELCSKQPAESQPKATINATSLAGTSFASSMGNIHPRMMSGPIPNLFGYDSSINNQFDVSFATHYALSIYHALINDTLNAGLSQSQLAKAIVSEGGAENNKASNNKKPLYPYRAILQTTATVNAPATIRCYVTPTDDMNQHVPHRGFLYSEHLQKRLREEQRKGKEEEDEKKKKEDATRISTETEKKKAEGNEKEDGEEEKNDGDLMLTDLNEIPTEISTETFPQFAQQRTITLTVLDGKDEVIWAQGVVLTGVEVDAK